MLVRACSLLPVIMCIYIYVLVCIATPMRFVARENNRSAGEGVGFVFHHFHAVTICVIVTLRGFL